jgi:glyoxylase-like metal-dependent hydrolase (beta-lactamase superfamily II)
MQVAEGVHQFKIPMRHNPLGYTYSYLLIESKTLIDAGIPSWEAFSALEKQLSELETHVKDLQRVIITHMHNDHVGLIDYIRERADVKTLAHRVAEERQQVHLRGSPANGRRIAPAVPKPLRTRLQGGSPAAEA